MSESFWASQDSKTVDETGAKIKQTKSKEDRTADYREWRWNCTNSGYVTDVDHVEWRVVNGVLKPVALFELTRVDRDIVPHQNYLNSIIDRFIKRDGQGKMIKQLGEKLEAPVFIIAFLKDLSTFFVYNLSHPKKTKNNGWWILPQNKYKDWLKSLGKKAAISEVKTENNS